MLEGGSIDVNGRGTLLTTEECLLSPSAGAQSRASTRAEIEAILRDYLGATRRPLARTRHRRRRHARPHRRPRALRRSRHRGHRGRSRPLRRQLRAAAGKSRAPARDERPGRPRAARRNAAHARSPCTSTASACRPATPISTSPTDSCWCRHSTIRTTASRSNTLAALFPDREVIGIACRDLVLGLGTLHCMTQQQPR